MLKPSSFVTQPDSVQPAQNSTLANTNVPREIILMGSILTIAGLIGMSVLGFRLYKDFETTTRAP